MMRPAFFPQKSRSKSSPKIGRSQIDDIYAVPLSRAKIELRHQMHDQVHIRLAPGSRFLRQLSVFIVLDGSRQNVNLVTRCMIRFTFAWHQVHVF